MGCNNVVLNSRDLQQYSAIAKQSSVLYQCTERKIT